MEQQSRICIMIPAYNEEAALAKVIDEVRQCGIVVDIVVMSDASRDRTAEIACGEGVPVLDLPINLGIGGAMQTGFKYAFRNNYGAAMQLDGDGQHDPRFIGTLLEPILRGEADMVIGSRFMGEGGYKATPMRFIGMWIFSYLIGLVTNRRITDPTSGYRAYNAEAMQFAARYYPQDFPEPESIVLMIRNGFRLKEVPVVMRERLSGLSSVRPLKAAYFVASNALAIIITGIKRKKRI